MRLFLRGLVVALIFLFVGVASAAAVFEYVPSSGSAPSIYDDFNWSSISNGFWHVNVDGGTARIKHSVVVLKGHDVELDRRIQTDPVETIVVVRVRGLSFRKFAIGTGLYHSGTVALEFDDDGIKCGSGTDHGWKVDFMRGWSKPPIGQWFYLELDVFNPFPNVTHLTESQQKKALTLRCSAFDAKGLLLSSVVPHTPPPNSHYASLDEVYMRTWDSHNDYQIDWLYAGPPSGNPLRLFVKPLPLIRIKPKA